MEVAAVDGLTCDAHDGSGPAGYLFALPPRSGSENEDLLAASNAPTWLVYPPLSHQRASVEAAREIAIQDKVQPKFNSLVMFAAYVLERLVNG